jgi:transcriptional enhancer factor
MSCVVCIQFWQPAGPTNNEDIKPFNAPTGGQYVNNSNNNLNSGPAWEGRAIATHKLRLVEFSAFMERHDNDSDKHLFVHIGIISPVYSDPLLESVDIRQIYDKFPEKKGGLKELYDKGPQNAFFLVKFWADLNTSLLDESGAFYGVTSHYESNENMTITCSTKVCSFGKQVVEKVEVSLTSTHPSHSHTRAIHTNVCLLCTTDRIRALRKRSVRVPHTQVSDV